MRDDYEPLIREAFILINEIESLLASVDVRLTLKPLVEC